MVLPEYAFSARPYEHNFRLTFGHSTDLSALQSVV